jgi:hypothetical protein
MPIKRRPIRRPRRPVTSIVAPQAPADLTPRDYLLGLLAFAYATPPTVERVSADWIHKHTALDGDSDCEDAVPPGIWTGSAEVYAAIGDAADLLTRRTPTPYGVPVVHYYSGTHVGLATPAQWARLQALAVDWPTNNQS